MKYHAVYEAWAFCPTDRSAKTDAEIKSMIQSTTDIGSLRDWEHITLSLGAYLDDRVLFVLGKLLGPPDIKIVKEDGQRIVDALTLETAPLRTNMVLRTSMVL